MHTHSDKEYTATLQCPSTPLACSVYLGRGSAPRSRPVILRLNGWTHELSAARLAEWRDGNKTFVSSQWLILTQQSHNVACLCCHRVLYMSSHSVFFFFQWSLFTPRCARSQLTVDLPACSEPTGQFVWSVLCCSTVDVDKPATLWTLLVGGRPD